MTERYEDSLDGKFRMIISHRQMGYEENNMPIEEFDEMLEDLVKAASPKWISVKDELPEIHSQVITYVVELGMDTASRNSPLWKKSNITHWMLLKPPEES